MLSTNSYFDGVYRFYAFYIGAELIAFMPMEELILSGYASAWPQLKEYPRG